MRWMLAPHKYTECKHHEKEEFFNLKTKTMSAQKQV